MGLDPVGRSFNSVQRVLRVMRDIGVIVDEPKFTVLPVSEVERVAALGDTLRLSIRADTAESLAAEIAALMVQLSHVPYRRETAPRPLRSCPASV